MCFEKRWIVQNKTTPSKLLQLQELPQLSKIWQLQQLTQLLQQNIFGEKLHFLHTFFVKKQKTNGIM